VRWYEPYESRGSRTDLREARGEIPWAYPAAAVTRLFININEGESLLLQLDHSHHCIRGTFTPGRRSAFPQ
jgi:hypothetical protein